MEPSQLEDGTPCVQLFSDEHINEGVHKYRGNTALALKRHTMWDNGTTLRVRFLGGSNDLQARVKKYANQWTTYANISFDWVTDGDAVIRVGFKQDGSYWSYIGTSNKLYTSQDEQTMNLSLSDDSSDDTCRRKAIHEFGHALGCIHEHQSPDADIPWDKPKVYNYYEKIGWSKEKVDRNILTVASAEATVYSDFDTASIMLYPIPSDLTDGAMSVGWNSVLSVRDKAFISQVYPRTDAMGGYETTNDARVVSKGGKNSATIFFSPDQDPPPQVVVGLRLLDMGNSSGNMWALRIRSYVNNITTNQFTLHIDSWADTMLYNAGVSWFKLAANDPDFQVGTFDTESVRPWDQPGNVTQWVSFPQSFTTTPLVFVGLTEFDIGDNWRIHIWTEGETKYGFNVHVDTWGSSQLYSAMLTWIAFPNNMTGVLIGEFEGNSTDGFSGHLNFASSFDHTPGTFTALTYFDVDHSHNFRVKVKTTNTTTTGMDWKFETWWDTTIYKIRAAYLALDM